MATQTADHSPSETTPLPTTELRNVVAHAPASVIKSDCSRLCQRKEGEDVNLLFVDAGRKRVLGIMAAILAARKLSQFEGNARVPATIYAIADAIRWAEEIMKRIDERWTPHHTNFERPTNPASAWYAGGVGLPG